MSVLHTHTCSTFNHGNYIELTRQTPTSLEDETTRLQQPSLLPARITRLDYRQDKPDCLTACRSGHTPK